MKTIKLAQFILIMTCLTLFASYFYKIDSVPFVRLDDGELMQLSETFATHGYLGSEMMDTGHNEHLYYHVHPPFYYLVNGLVFKLAGVGVTQSRLVSLVSALAIILLTFLLAGQMLKLPLSRNNFLLLAAFFLSTPLFFVLARSNRPEMLTLLLALSAILTYSNYQKTRKIIFSMFSGLLAGLALTTQAYAAFVILFLVFSQYLDRQKNWRLIGLFLVAFALPLTIYLAWIFRDLPSFYYQTVIIRQAADKLNLVALLSRYRAFFSSLESIVTTICFFASVTLALFLKQKNQDRSTALFPERLLLGILCFLAIFLLIPVLNKYYYVVLLPFIYLFFVYTLNKYRHWAFVALFCLYFLTNLLGLAFFWQKYHDFDYPAYGRRIIAQLPAPGSFSVLASPSLYPALRSYQFYAFNNGSIVKPDQTYQGFKRRIEQLGIKYIVVQEYNDKLYAGLAYLNRFLKNDCHLIAKVQDPYYGSEGVKRNNYIKIYSVVIR
ncbi:MAG: glycosyltransferase family 39 protein [Desulfotomaculaceae bacterium]